MDSPVSGVLEIYELLERILLAVPMQELFVTQRVSKDWKTIIERSQALQKKMFLLADGQPLTPTPSLLGRVYEPKYQDTLRLPSVVGVACLSEKHSDKSNGESNGESNDSDEDEDPLPDEFCVYRMPAPESVMVASDLRPQYGYKDPGQPERGWRKVLIARPPITAVKLQGQRKSAAEEYDTIIECMAYNPAGLTLGDIRDLCGRLHKQSLEHASTTFDEVYMQFTMALKAENQKNTNGADANGEMSNGDCSCDIISGLLDQ